VRWSLFQHERSRSGNHSGRIPDALSADLPIPTFLAKGSLIDCVLRLGTNQYKYPKHKDWAWNCLLQICGSKIVTFHPPFPLPGLNLSDLEASEVIQGGRCSCCRPTANGVLAEARLKPGDILFIPPQWSHSVESLEAKLNISVNFFWNENVDQSG